MAELTPIQKKVLILQSRGKKLTEIERELTKIERKKCKGYRSVWEASRRGRKNLDDAINTVEWAIKEHIIQPDQVQRLKKSLQKG